VRLCREVTTQLVAAQQRVAELTPLIEEVTNLQSRVVEAHRDADVAEKAFEACRRGHGRKKKRPLGLGRSGMSCSRGTLRPANGSLTFWARLRRKGI